MFERSKIAVKQCAPVSSFPKCSPILCLLLVGPLCNCGLKPGSEDWVARRRDHHPVCNDLGISSPDLLVSRAIPPHVNKLPG